MLDVGRSAMVLEEAEHVVWLEVREMLNDDRVCVLCSFIDW